MKKLSLMMAIQLCMIISMIMVSTSSYAITPVKTKEYYSGKKVTLYPLDNGYYTIETISVQSQVLALQSGKLYYADYGDGAGVFLGIEVTLQDGRQDFISFALADYWAAEKDKEQKGKVYFDCWDETTQTLASVYAVDKNSQGLIIVNPNHKILVKYNPSTLVRMNPISALEKIFELDDKYKK